MENREQNLSQHPASADDKSEIISRLYDVALDPARYEALLDRWEETFGPLREDAGRLSLSPLDDQSITAHFRRADLFLDKFTAEDTEDERTALLSQFDKVTAIMFSECLNIEKLNQSAKQVLDVSEGQTLFALPIDDSDLDALGNKIREMIRAGTKDASVFRVRSKTSGKFIVFHLRLCLLQDATPLVIAITSEVKWPANFDSILQSAFEFTNAEVDVVRMLIECCSLKDIAERRGRAIDTIRAQLKSILAKTETNSQTELVRLTLSMMDIAGFTMEVSPRPHLTCAGTDKLKALPFHSLHTESGRQVDYVLLGDPAGKPVVFLPLDYGLIRWPASAEAAAEAQGIKVIVPVRAGYGATDPHAKQLPFREGVTDDLALILDHENVARCPIVTLGSDTYFAFHYALKFPKQVSAIIACAGTLPFTRAAQYERMEKWHRFILAGARYTPHLLPFMVKAGFLLARRIGKRNFIKAVYGNNPADIETFDDPETYEAMVTGSEIALSESHCAHAAFARQVVEQENEDWTRMVNAIRGQLPVFFINGLQDPQVPPETLAEFQQEHPWITYETFEDAGQLIFFKKWPLVLKKIHAFL